MVKGSVEFIGLGEFVGFVEFDEVSATLQQPVTHLASSLIDSDLETGE
jgi:hypothetical protein